MKCIIAHCSKCNHMCVLVKGELKTLSSEERLKLILDDKIEFSQEEEEFLNSSSSVFTQTENEMLNFAKKGDSAY